MANFQDILSKPAANIEPPKPLPVGTYLCIIDGQPEFAKIGKEQTDCLNFKLKPIQAQPDVDQTALQEALVVNGAPSALGDKSIRHRLFITEASIWRLKQFLVDHLGIEQGTKSLGELIPESQGRQVLVTLGHRASDDGQQVFTEVKATAKV